MGAFPMPSVLSDQAIKLLRELARESGDGYTLMSRTGIKDESQFSRTVQELRNQSLVEVKGDTSSDRVGESFLYVPIEARGNVNFLLGGSRSAAL
jgi:predicted transcriptional regulator